MKYYILLPLFLFISNCIQAQTSIVVPTRSQIEWADAEIGVIIHYDINVFAPETFDYAKKETLPDLSVFNPSKLNTDQWLEAAQKFGAKYAVLVAKHGTGFCLWPTSAHDYHIGNTPFRNGQGDIVKDFIKSCRKYNIKPGIYYNTNSNTLYGAGYKKMNNEDRLAYNNIVYQQLTELWTNYGKLFEIWFDGGVMVDPKVGIADKVTQLIEKHQPDAILFQGPLSCNNLIRWAGNEEGRAPYPNWSTADAITSSDGRVDIPNLHGSSTGEFWMPAESDFPNRKKSSWNGGWLWKAGEESHLFSVDELVDRYYTSVGQNSNMLIGMVIDTTGLFPEADSKIFEEFGKEIKERFSNQIAKTKGNDTNLLMEFAGGKSQMFNQVIIEEDISKGERILKYVVEAFHENKWKPLCEGSSVGHKRIQIIENTTASIIRLKILEYKDIPRIKNFSVYRY